MKLMWSAAVVVVMVSAAAAAQSTRDMGAPMMADKMSTTYTGCVEAVNHGGTFMLTRIGDGQSMAMDQGATMGKMDGKARGVVLSGSTHLKKHVGQKVTVTGWLSTGAKDTMRDDLDTLTISSLKVVAKSCS